MFQTLKSPHARFLYILQNLFKEEKLSFEQKNYLKVQLIKENPEILTLLQNFIPDDLNPDILKKLIIDFKVLEPKRLIHKNTIDTKIEENSEKNDTNNDLEEVNSESDEEEAEEDQLNTEEELKLEEKMKNRANSDLVDLKRASFSDYFNLVHNFYRHGSADDIDEGNIIKECANMENSGMSKISERAEYSPKTVIPSYKQLKSFKTIENTIMENSSIHDKYKTNGIPEIKPHDFRKFHH